MAASGYRTRPPHLTNFGPVCLDLHVVRVEAFTWPFQRMTSSSTVRKTELSFANFYFLLIVPSVRVFTYPLGFGLRCLIRLSQCGLC